MNNFNRNNRNNTNMYNQGFQRQQGGQNGMNRTNGNQSVPQEKTQNHNQTHTAQNSTLDNLMNKASKHLNTTPDELKNAAQNGGLQKLLSNMTPSQAAQLEKILSDENATKKLLSTPQAQALLRGLQRNE